MRKISVTLTQKDGRAFAGKRPVAFAKDDWREMEIVNVYDDVEYQAFDGFGGAITEAAAVTFKKLSKACRKKVIDMYYDPKKGIGYTIARVHINSCDFSTGNYACVEKDGDFELKSFSVARDKQAVIPMVRLAQKALGRKLWVLASPWSPPAWMKTTGKMNEGGKLRDDCRRAWARYYAKFVKAFRREGVDVRAITIQNEPKAVQKWDSCIYTAEEERDFIRDYLGKALAEEGLSGDVAVYIWDHNKERLYDRTATIMADKRAARYVAGSAFHWYSGSHFESVSLTARQFPKLKLLASECCVEYSNSANVENWTRGERYGLDIIGNLNNGMTGWLDWNVLLDVEGGPNHVGNFCAAPIMMKTKTGSSITVNPSYYYIGHFSKFIRPGAKRVGVTTFSDAIRATAFKNPDGTVATVVINPQERAVKFWLRNRGETAGFEMPPRSIATLTFKP